MVAEPAPKVLDEVRVQLDRRDRTRAFRERERETPCAGADLHRVVGGADTCVTNELGRDQCTTKEVLALRPDTACPRCARVRAHGRSPRSYPFLILRSETESRAYQSLSTGTRYLPGLPRVARVRERDGLVLESAVTNGRDGGGQMVPDV
jgi:hypothetical protein